MKKLVIFIILLNYITLRSQEDIHGSIRKFETSAKSHGIKKLYYNFDALNAKEFKIDTIPESIGSWEMVDTVKGSTELEMLEKGQRLPFRQALQLITNMVTNGEFDIIPTYRLIFLVEKDSEGNELAIACNRREGSMFRVYIRPVNKTNKWNGPRNSWLVTN